MTIAESRRLALFASAKTSWGEDTAQTLMDLLPPDPDALATRADLALLKADLALVKGELLERMSDLTRVQVLATMGSTITIVLALVLG